MPKEWTLSEQALDKAMQFVLDTIEIPDTVIKMLRDNINAKLEEKQLLLRMIIDEITYADGGIKHC